MTKEEKVRAYDEALRKIRPLYERAKKEDCPIWSTYEYVFPELAESEDKRITRAINNMLPFIPDEAYANNGVTKEECLAWLEKQKELPTNEEMLRTLRTEYEKGVADTIAKYEQQEQKLKESPVFEIGDKITDGASTFTVVGIKEGHYLADDGDEVCFYVAHRYYTLDKENKPSEWSEFDKEMLQNVYESLYSYQCYIRGGEMDKNSRDLLDDVEREKDWLKYLPERFNLQPKQEWSEEDDYRIRWIISLLTTMQEKGIDDSFGNSVPDDIPDMLAWFKSLRPQSVQLKESYKEGFQTARRAIATAFMEYCDKIRPNGKMCLSNGECEDIENAFLVGDWKKIGRYFHKYSWKPSKAQITALKVVARGFPADDPDAIDSLLHDLEKLM